MFRLLSLTALALLLSAGLSVSAVAQDKLTILLDWFVNPDHARAFIRGAADGGLPR